jgi:S1-C subfamily serine protease
MTDQGARNGWRADQSRAVAGELAAAFGRPPGVTESFAPAPLPPPNRAAPPPPSPAQRRTFGRRPGVDGPFDPPPGARPDFRPEPESPWWKPDAARDPWRDAGSPASLGGPPDFGDGRTADVVGSEDPGSGGTRRWGLRNLTLTAAVVLLLAGLLTGLTGGVVGYLAASRITPALLDPDATLSSVSPPVERPPGSIADIARRVLPVVVSVEVNSSAGSGTGSGVVIDGGGYVLTNNHVISEVATSSGGTLRVRFSDQSAATARIAGRDPKTDLAVLKVEKAGLAVASLGDSSKIAVGDPVIAVGSPLGLASTVTSGIVSALDRPVRLGGEGGNSGSDTNAVINAIQTDASINPGNSGGALVDGSGAVIGINSAIATLSSGTGQSGSIGLGFAIPINEARQIAQQLIRTGKVQHATLGVTARSVTDGARDGALVESVTAGSAAAGAGIKAGDVITRVGDRLVGGSDDLTVQVRSHQVGEKVQLTYVRGGRTTKATATLQGD